MTISNIFYRFVNFIRDAIGGVPLEYIGEIKDVFGDECALCIESSHGSSYVELMDDVFIPTCRSCKKKINSGITWTALLKANFQNKNRRYSNKYLRIVAWMATSD